MSKTLHLPPIDAHALWAATYDRSPNAILSVEERYVEPLLPAIAGMDVLDVACGTGRWLVQLLRRRPARAVGLDLSPEMLQQAKRKPGAGPLLQADALGIPLRAASMDFAICSFGLSYITNIQHFAQEIARVLRNQGRLILSDFHPSAQARGWKRSFRHNDAIVEVSSFPRTIDHIQETFAKVGLELTNCLEPSFGEEELPIFESCGKASVFEALLGQPAIVVLVFRRAEKSPSREKGRVRDSVSTYLIGGRIALNAQAAIQANLEISGGRIRRVVDDPPPDDAVKFDLRNYLLLPGLINPHDHLEFNLFPRLGRGPYPSCADWAHDIYHPQRSPVREHLSVPKTVRLWWGGLKNLLSGVTTVCHHNPWDEAFDQEYPVQVVRRYGWAHSTFFDKDVFRAFASTDPVSPFIIHAGEGTDQRSRDEVFELDRMGVLDRRTVLVHGVGFSEAGHRLVNQRGGSLVWCPTSNRFVLGTTLNIRSLGNFDRVALGSDSALTAQGSLLDEIHAAGGEGTSAHAIYRMVTETAAWILRLTDGEGTLQPNAIANIIAVPWTGKTPADTIMQVDSSRIHMVMVAGRLHLISDEFIPRCQVSEIDGLEWIEVNGVRRRVRAPIPWLISETATHLGAEIRLAGMKVSV